MVNSLLVSNYEEREIQCSCCDKKVEIQIPPGDQGIFKWFCSDECFFKYITILRKIK